MKNEEKLFLILTSRDKTIMNLRSEVELLRQQYQDLKLSRPKKKKGLFRKIKNFFRQPK